MRVMIRHRAVYALTAIAYLVGYLLVFAHFVAERHVECIEHHTAHHADASSDDHEAAPAQAGLSALPVTEDHHCDLLSLVRPKPTTSERARLVVRPPNLTITCGVHAPSTHTFIGGAVWRYAPKTSPPHLS